MKALLVEHGWNKVPAGFDILAIGDHLRLEKDLSWCEGISQLFQNKVWCTGA